MPRQNANSVLLVDDADDEREMYAESLRLRGYRTLQAQNGDDALRLARELLPVAVVTDVVLRGAVDGFTLTSSLKQEPVTREIPVIVLTGRVFEADREAAARAGSDLLLLKPCSPDELVRQVRRCAAIRRLGQIRGRPVSATALSQSKQGARRKASR